MIDWVGFLVRLCSWELLVTPLPSFRPGSRTSLSETHSTNSLPLTSAHRPNRFLPFSSGSLFFSALTCQLFFFLVDVTDLPTSEIVLWHAGIYLVLYRSERPDGESTGEQGGAAGCAGVSLSVSLAIPHRLRPALFSFFCLGSRSCSCRCWRVSLQRWMTSG